MSASPFVDTNVVVYALIGGGKQPIAKSLVTGGVTISVQVLNEFVHVARRKFGRSWADVEEALSFLRLFSTAIADINDSTHTQALMLARDHGIQIFDALVVASARHAGCTVLYSEDMQHGRRFGDLTVVNPFASL